MGRRLLDALSDGPLLGDGAMGTQLQGAGLEPGGCGEAWNLEAPDRVLAIQRHYVEAGSDCLLTNTFGASRIMLGRHGRAGDAAAINRAGVAIACEAFGGRRGFVIGDIGPFGGLIAPLGEVPAVRVRQALDEQAAALVEAGADALLLETQTSLEELGLGIAAAQSAGAACVIGSLAFDVLRDGSDVRTMMGVSPERAADFLASAGADVLALNCGRGIDVARAIDVVRRYRALSDLPIMVQPNAGDPELDGDAVVYREDPESMADRVPALVAAGAGIVGACCGSGPAHIAAFRRRLDARGPAR